MLKIGSNEASRRAHRRASTNLHKVIHNYGIGLLITINGQNVRVGGNGVTENDIIIDSWMNMPTLLASRPRRRARSERGLRHLATSRESRRMSMPKSKTKSLRYILASPGYALGLSQ